MSEERSDGVGGGVARGGGGGRGGRRDELGTTKQGHSERHS